MRIGSRTSYNQDGRFSPKEGLMNMEKELTTVGNHWSQHEPEPEGSGYYGFPPLRPYLIETAFGKDLAVEHQQNPWWAEDIFVLTYLRSKKVESVISLACGFGSVERRIVSQLPDVKHCIGVDIAQGALKVARQRAVENGLQSISYECANLNNYHWEKGKFDLVIANGALHHLRNLEGVFEGIRYTLKPGGILYGCEYVGASYQDHPVRQLELINAAAYLIPPELRGRKRIPFANRRIGKFLSRLYAVADRQERPEWSPAEKIVASISRKIFKQKPNVFNFGIVHVSPKDHLLRTDPSECVRSSEIIPLIKKYFPEVEIRPFGGGILMHALHSKFYECYDQSNSLHTKTLEMLCQLEKHFMETNETSIENAFLIAIK